VVWGENKAVKGLFNKEIYQNLKKDLKGFHRKSPERTWCLTGLEADFSDVFVIKPWLCQLKGVV